MLLSALLDLLFSVAALKVSFCLLLRTVMRFDPSQRRVAAERICTLKQVLGFFFCFVFVLNSSHMKLFLSRLRNLEEDFNKNLPSVL